MQDTTRSIVHSTLRFFSGTMLSRISGLLRDIAMAYAFGTQSTIAALFVAFRFAHLLRRLLGEGALQTAFIPHFEGLRRENPFQAALFYVDLNLSLSSLLIVVITSVSTVLGCFYLFGGLSEGNAEIVWLTLLMMPSLFFICLFGVNASLLQCEKSYFIPSAAPIAFNVVWIIGVFSVSHLPIQQAMSGLAIFIIVACLFQWAVTLPKVYQVLHMHHLPSLWKQSKNFSKAVKNLGTPLALGILGVAASQINSALDAIFARWADPQGPALLWYAIRLQQLPLALFGVALSGALLPPLARAIRAGEWNTYRYFLDFALTRSIALMLPLTAALFVAGDLCIALIYGHGDFSNASIVGTTKVLWGYSFGLIPMTLVLIIAPAFYAQNDYKTPSIASVNAVIANCLLNVLFVGGLGLGADAVAWATGISAWINLFFLGTVLIKQHKIRWGIDSPKLFGMICIITLAASLFSLGISFVIFGAPTIGAIIEGHIPEYSRTIAVQLSQLAIPGVIFTGALAFLAVLGRKAQPVEDS